MKDRQEVVTFPMSPFLICAILLKFLLPRVVLKFNEMMSAVLVRFIFILAQANIKWEEELPLTNNLHQFACKQVCGAFSLLLMVVMIYMGGPSPLW